METKLINQVRNSAFSLIELLAVVATFAILGGIAIAFISNTHSGLEVSKLEQDTSRLNSAIKVFVSNGGSLEGINTAQEALTELKKAAADQRSVVGLRGSAIDFRLRALDENNSELRKRAVWKPTTQRFALENSRTGVREFVLDEALAKVEYTNVGRETRLVYNNVDGWVWQTVDYNYASAIGPSSLPTVNTPTLGATPSGGLGNTSQLNLPIITPGTSTLKLTDYPLVVNVRKHFNDPVSADIFYSINSKKWKRYTGPFTIEPGTTVTAYTNHEDPMWDESDYALASYTNDVEELEIAVSIPKNPITYAEAGGALEEGNYTPVGPLAPITISHASSATIPARYVNSDNFRVYWTYDGSNPLTSQARHGGGKFSDVYSGGNIDYTLPQWDGVSMLPIKIAAEGLNDAVVSDSDIVSADITITKTDLPVPSITYDDSNTHRGDTVEIEKVVDSGDMPIGARIYYTTDGTDPGDDGEGNPLTGTLYTGSFDPLLNEDNETEATIVARVYPPAEYANWFNVSELSEVDYEIPAWEISGNSEGWFSGADGSSSMVADYSGENTQSIAEYVWGGRRTGWEWIESIVAGNQFGYGTAAWWEGAGIRNSLQFSGANYENVTAGQQFLVGTLDYYNGTITSNSGATAVDLAVDLAFGETRRTFDFSFDLLNVANNSNAWSNNQSAWASADYVQFNNTSSAQSINLFGTDYSLVLEFGETTSSGFSNIDQFHVLEDRGATANIYATLIDSISMNY